MPTDINYALEDLDMEERKGYELLQGFCVYNMKQEEKANRVIGSLCLTKLVENCPVVLQEKYMKFIWDNIITFIEMKNYTAKYELLNCLISLILGAENLFIPYANATLYKVLDFLSEDDSNKRKLALNVIYTLIYYCKEEILPLKEHIISFLKVLKTDKVKEVREVCLLILQIFNENEPKKKEKQKTIGGIINTKKGNFEKKDSGEIEKNNKNKNRPKTGNKMKKNNKFFENNKKFEKNPFKDNSFDNVNNTNYNKKNSNNININNNTNNNDEGEINIKVISTQNKFNKDTSNNTIATGHVSSLSSTQNKSKSKKSNNFVNEKMIIKPDPNKSIFKAVPNPGFFNQANQKNNDIVIMPKKKPKQIISNNNNMNINNKLSNNDTYHNNNEKNKIEKKKDMNSNYQKEIKTKEKEDLRYTKMFENEEEDMHIKETEEENNVIRNNKNNIIDYDESINEKENKYEIEAVDKNIIQKLLNQMEFLTKGQSSLEKMFNNIQMDTQDQIESMNINYDKLLSKTNKLHQEFDNYHLNGY